MVTVKPGHPGKGEKEKTMSTLHHYIVDADRTTGEWLGEPEHVGEVTEAEWYAREDTADEHFDTYEHGSDSLTAETRAITVRWVSTTPRTATLHEYDQFIGSYSVEDAPNEFLRALILEALEYGEATAVDPEGCPVSAIADEQ